MSILSNEAHRLAARYDESRNAITKSIQRHPWTTFLAAAGGAALAFWLGRTLGC